MFVFFILFTYLLPLCILMRERVSTLGEWGSGEIWEELGESKEYNQNILLENEKNHCFDKVRGTFLFACVFFVFNCL